MENGNLALWDRVCTTPASVTSPMSGAFAGTAIKPAYAIRMATEMFGPCGIGWGYEVLEEGFVDGAVLGYDAQGKPLGHSRVHILKLKTWYVYGEKKGELTHFGQTPFIGLNSAGERVVTDGDVKKKSLTDALMKCLSLLGIGADVHLGLYDDPAYLDARIRDEGAKRAKGSKPPAAEATTQSDPGTAKGATPQAPGADVEQWLKRIKILGSDAIRMSRSTVLTLFSGEDLKRVQTALDQREQQLAASHHP